YDGTWPDISVAGEAETRKWVADTRAQLAQLPRNGLSEQNQIDAMILDDQLRERQFELDELKGLEHNPTRYTGLIGEGLDPLVSRDFGTKESRMTALRGRLEGIPAIVAVARERL